MGCRDDQWTRFADRKIGYRCIDRSAGNGLERHGNASRRVVLEHCVMNGEAAGAAAKT